MHDVQNCIVNVNEKYCTVVEYKFPLHVWPGRRNTKWNNKYANKERTTVTAMIRTAMNIAIHSVQ